MIRNTLNFQIKGSLRIYVLAICLVLEAGGVWILWQNSAPRAETGFLLKVGQSYVIAWKDEHQTYTTRTFPRLKMATQLMRDLGLSLASTGNNSVEYLSLRDRYGSYILHWKRFGVNALNQISFFSHAEASYFANAIRFGAYTPSPFGHSIFLSRRNTK